MRSIGTGSCDWYQLLLHRLVLYGAYSGSRRSGQPAWPVLDNLSRDRVIRSLFASSDTKESISDKPNRVASCGVLILCITSFPASLEHGAGLPGLIVALVLIGLGLVILDDSRF
jgi:hypothetical protein